jgi:hypothetical protein
MKIERLISQKEKHLLSEIDNKYLPDIEKLRYIIENGKQPEVIGGLLKPIEVSRKEIHDYYMPRYVNLISEYTRMRIDIEQKFPSKFILRDE